MVMAHLLTTRKGHRAMSNTNRGFAAMDPEKHKAAASKGGKSAQTKGTAHRWTPEEAREAGRKGGKMSRRGKVEIISEPALPLVETPAAA